MINKILVPIDLRDEHSWQCTFPIAVREARANAAELIVMTVYEPLGSRIPDLPLADEHNRKARLQTEDTLQSLVTEQLPTDLSPRMVVRESESIYKEILKTSRELPADLIIMAAHHPLLRDYLLGSNAAKVVRHADCSVFVVRD